MLVGRCSSKLSGHELHAKSKKVTSSERSASQIYRVTLVIDGAQARALAMRRAKHLHHQRSRPYRPHGSQYRSRATGFRYRRQCQRPDQRGVGAVADHFGQITKVTQNGLCGNYNFTLRPGIFRLTPVIVGLQPTLPIEDLACN
jgi:hypothetical protein